jgi:hypothetical protein
MSAKEKSTENIIKDLLSLAKRIDLFTEDPANARLHSKKNIDTIKSSLTIYGQRKPIVVQKTKDGLIVRAGNGTLRAAKDLGWKSIAAVIVEESNTSATGFSLVDNRSSDLSEFDDEALAKLLKGLKDDEVDVKALGYHENDEAEIEALLNNIKTSTDSEWEGMPEFTEESKDSYRHVIVHFPNPESAGEFFKLIDQADTGSTKTVWFPPQKNMDTESKRYGDE